MPEAILFLADDDDEFKPVWNLKRYIFYNTTIFVSLDIFQECMSKRYDIASLSLNLTSFSKDAGEYTSCFLQRYVDIYIYEAIGGHWLYN